MVTRHTEPDEQDQRILAHMRRAPAGQYTAVQLARNTGLPLTEVQPRLARLLKQGVIARSAVTVYPAFHLSGPQAGHAATPVAVATAREAAERREMRRAS
jgi:DNA-binding Lrp family transcriptional regulator